MKSSLSLFFVSFCVLIVLASCKKDSFITSAEARLTITADSLKYDTVFTTTGSITKSFKIINENSQKLRLSKVKLMGGTASAFKINVNGTAATELNNVEIEANDSIYVFASVTINPNAANLPFIVSDSILINYNGNDRFVQLQAYGQNAVYLTNKVITGNVTWTNTLPFVILKSLRIDTTATLTIQPGTKIYSHADAPFIVDGTLIINGTKSNEVVFAGDRLDNDYKDLPAGWPGIYFRGNSKNNVLKFAVIKNAYQAVVATSPSVNANPKLILQQCIIDNAYDAGVLAANTSIYANNSLISNCGSNIALIYGGDYNFTNCTVASFSNLYLLHKNPVLTVSNFATQGGTTVTANLNATFRNCIFWADTGFVNNEVVVNKQGSNTFNVLFEKNLYRAQNDPANSTLTANIKNLYPQFDSIDISKRIYDFRITKTNTAPGINKGVATGFTKDLDDGNRNVGLPDLGCYEKQ
ncbi:hypothetical protein [Ferruginibacter sp. SUN106]|uniref:hypothetical protein n=1 Tax=Ferruginibacter sp. SUN106 TaxID=2978348 RepID=UPI003D36F013